MKQQTSPAIILRRTNYGEADRIITFITPVGKVRALVKGVRRSKSKLAGGIELFSESTITFIETRGELARIVSTRLTTHWDSIIGNLQRMMFGYEAMKLIDRVIEDDAEPSYYEVLKATLAALDQTVIDLRVIEIWFYLRLLNLLGRKPNLLTDAAGQRLVEDSLFNFSEETMSFSAHSSGSWRVEHVKLLRLSLQQPPLVVSRVQGSSQLAENLAPLLKQLLV